MDNDNKQYFIDDETLSPAALKRKHELETNPAPVSAGVCHAEKRQPRRQVTGSIKSAAPRLLNGAVFLSPKCILAKKLR